MQQRNTAEHIEQRRLSSQMTVPASPSFTLSAGLCLGSIFSATEGSAVYLTGYHKLKRHPRSHAMDTQVPL
jgi:hypothetical protein